MSPSVVIFPSSSLQTFKQLLHTYINNESTAYSRMKTQLSSPLQTALTTHTYIRTHIQTSTFYCLRPYENSILISPLLSQSSQSANTIYIKHHSTIWHQLIFSTANLFSFFLLTYIYTHTHTHIHTHTYIHILIYTSYYIILTLLNTLSFRNSRWLYSLSSLLSFLPLVFGRIRRLSSSDRIDYYWSSL